VTFRLCYLPLPFPGSFLFFPSYTTTPLNPSFLGEQKLCGYQQFLPLGNLAWGWGCRWIFSRRRFCPRQVALLGNRPPRLRVSAPSILDLTDHFSLETTRRLLRFSPRPIGSCLRHASSFAIVAWIGRMNKLGVFGALLSCLTPAAIPGRGEWVPVYHFLSGLFFYRLA